jgi:hypothetical protein
MCSFHLTNALFRRRPAVQTHWHELNIDVPIHRVRRRPPPRIPWQRQGLQRHQPFRLHGYDLAARQDQLLREACVRLLKSKHQPLEHAYGRDGFVA